MSTKIDYNIIIHLLADEDDKKCQWGKQINTAIADQWTSLLKPKQKAKPPIHSVIKQNSNYITLTYQVWNALLSVTVYILIIFTCTCICKVSSSSVVLCFLAVKRVVFLLFKNVIFSGNEILHFVQKRTMVTMVVCFCSSIKS